MEGRCRTCNKWQKHFYRRHFDAKGKLFLKVMETAFFNGMIIPEEIAKQCKVELAEAVDLKGPSGYTWRVKLRRKGWNYMLHGNGWKQFLLKNQVEGGDCLVFKYRGDLCFNVKMFDGSGLEKISPFFVKESFLLHRNSSHTEELGDDSHKVTSSGSSSDPASAVPLSTLEKFRDKNKRKEGVHGTEQNMFCSKRVRKELKKEPDDTHPTEKLTCSSVFVSRRRPVTDSERAGTLKRAYKIRLSNPSFLIAMKPTHVYRAFFMQTGSANFTENYIPQKRQTIILRLPNHKREWHVCYSVTSRRSGFSGVAWAHFVYDNNLEEGDACVFELTQSLGVLVMDVHIFRVVKEIVPFTVESK